MIRGIVCLGVLAFLWGPTWQTGEKAPSFEIADVHASPPSANMANRFRRGPFISGGRYEVRSATLLDLILLAYSPAGTVHSTPTKWPAVQTGWTSTDSMSSPRLLHARPRKV